MDQPLVDGSALSIDAQLVNLARQVESAGHEPPASGPPASTLGRPAPQPPPVRPRLDGATAHPRDPAGTTGIWDVRQQPGPSEVNK